MCHSREQIVVPDSSVNCLFGFYSHKKILKNQKEYTRDKYTLKGHDVNGVVDDICNKGQWQGRPYVHTFTDGGAPR